MFGEIDRWMPNYLNTPLRARTKWCQTVAHGGLSSCKPDWLINCLMPSQSSMSSAS